VLHQRVRFFAWTDADAMQARHLRDSLVAALESRTRIPVFLLLAVASYFPLHPIPFTDRLLEYSWPRVVEAVLVQQVREPEEERTFRDTFPRLTAIDDEVSLLVRNEYEENPYPRWIKSVPVGSPDNIDRMCYRKFPLASFRPLGKNGNLDILIAGCGTGQQSINTARSDRDARVLAVDLSLSSLRYAKRKTQEIGLTMIEYAQADIMRLDSLGRSFDVIESVGVLHHLADPLAGLSVLLSLLRPRGLMHLGFHSEVARQGVVLARSFIAEHGYGSTAADIRQCR
jgi:2-polyprenyl-3-methyl-5-hydroxy-6-metoxy-1,4-benzoquinol methylase